VVQNTSRWIKAEGRYKNWNKILKSDIWWRDVMCVFFCIKELYSV